MLKHTHKYIALLLLPILALSGCGGEKDGVPDNRQTPPITLQMRQQESFNPLNVEHHSVRDAFSLCYEPLFAIGDKMELEGVLARNIQIADNCESAIVMLKDSVTWHDGVKLTSSDVVHTINLLKENPSWEYADCVKYIENAYSMDPLTVKLELSRPYGQIGYSLYFPVVAAHNTVPDEKMIGTGAFRFKEYVPATTLSLTRFDSWHGGETECSDVTVSIIRDNMAATTAFNTGLIDTVTGDSFDLENSTPKVNARTTLYPSNEYEFLAFNHNRGIFASQNVRSAISSAIDRSAVVKDCYGGSAVAANAPTHPGAQDLAESSIMSQYSLSNASELLFLEGYSPDKNTRVLKNDKGQSLSFTLLVNEENVARVKCAKLLSQQLFAAGIEVNVSELPFEKYTEKIQNGSYDAYLGGTRLSNLYDLEFLLSEDGALNNFGYEGADMKAALDALSASPTTDSLSNAVFNFEEVFLREQPVCGLVFRMNTLITSESVMGKLLPQMNSPYRNIWRWSLR